MFSKVLVQVENYFKQANQAGLAELAKTWKESQQSLTQTEWRSSAPQATMLIAMQLLLAEIYSRQALLAVQEEYSEDNAFVASEAYQNAIITCNSAIDDFEVALKNDLTVDRALLQESNSYKLDEPRTAKNKIRDLVLSPLEEYLSIPDGGDYYSITPN